MKQIYVFTRIQNDNFPDAVKIGDLLLAPMLDSDVDALISNCIVNNISHAELTANEIINDTDTQVMITSYENAKEVCNYLMPDEQEVISI